MKILFLAANPVDVPTRLRIDEEIRAISQKIQMGTHRDQIELRSEWALRVGDLQTALLKHKPDIVHFSGHCNKAGEIILEDEVGHRTPVSQKALCGIFTTLKTIRMVVLNACHAKDLAEALAMTIDFAIGMNADIEDKDAMIFSSHFYQALSFGYSVKESFDLARYQLEIEGSKVAHVPELLVRVGADPSKFQIGAEPPPALEDERISDTARDREFSYPDIARPTRAAEDKSAGDPVMRGIAGELPEEKPLLNKADGSGNFNGAFKARRAVMLVIIAMVIAVGLWLTLPFMARYYNERGIKLQYAEPPDLSRARESFERAVWLNPSYAQAHYNLALVQEDLQLEKAIEEYLLAIRYDSHIYAAYNNLARLYLLRGEEKDYESALNLLNQARDLSPQDENVQYSLYKNLGWANYLLANHLQAEQDLGRAISLRKDKAAAHCLLAYVLKELGRAGVDDECSDCVSLEPGQKDVEAKWVSDARECLMKGDIK